MIPVRLMAESSSALDEALSELASAPREFLQRFVDRPHLVAKLFRIDSDLLAASAANEMRIVLQPSERLLELVAALRTGDVDHV